jgi:hypothetical protein
MLKAPNKYLVLFLILIFAFAYRMMLMHWQTFPPGADIGLHDSVIHSITISGNTNFLWNYYQMGGGESLTFPGYHIFVSYIILLTGMPDYLAHSVVVSFFSSLIILCAFLITRTVWGESASLIVAFLVAISRFDVEMLLWGGYANVITLMLIPLTFYLFLQKKRFSISLFLTVTSILSGAIFLTHSLSAAIFVSVTVATVFFVSIFSKRVGVPKTDLFIWLVPLFLGAIIVSPFLLEIAPAYLSTHVETFTGGVSAIRLAVLSTKILPLEIVLPLLVSFVFFFLLSKKYRGTFLTVPAFLFAMWLLIPSILTQGFLFGLYFDYHRFLYFVLLPVVMLIALAIDHVSRFFSRIINTYLSITKGNSPIKNGGNKIISRLMPHLTRKNLYSAFVLGFLLFSFLAVPIFLTLQEGIVVSSFYQVMTEPGYEAIQWIRQQTPVGSVLVSDAEYGWWLAGFAQRPTLSAVDPQYLTLTREFEPAEIAKSLLDTDYLVDNGLIQIREDGGYIGRHNPMFLAKLTDNYFPYPFFHFNNDEITVEIRDGDGNVQLFDLSQVPVKDMHIENDTSYASIYVTRVNQLFSFTQKTTIYQGIRFVNMTETIENIDPAVTFSTVRFILHIKGIRVKGENETVEVLVDPNMNVAGQLIFTEGQPQTTLFTEENPSCLEMLYNLDGKFKAELKFSVGVYQFKPDANLNAGSPKKLWIEHGQELLANDTMTYMRKAADFPLDVFDYQKAMNDKGISYIVCRDSDVFPKFANDPAFSLVFINDEVAIFIVKRNFDQLGRPPSS